MSHYDCNGCGQRDCICPPEPKHEEKLEWIITRDYQILTSVEAKEKLGLRAYFSYKSFLSYDDALEDLIFELEDALDDAELRVILYKSELKKRRKEQNNLEKVHDENTRKALRSGKKRTILGF